MKSIKIYSVLFFLLGIYAVKSQVGIGTTMPNVSAVLEMSSTNKGLLYPRMTTIKRLAIPNPAEGLQVFDTDFKCMMLFANSQWACFPRTETLNTSIVSVIQFAGFTGHIGTSRVLAPSAILYNPQNWIILNGNRVQFIRPGKYQINIYAYARRQNAGSSSGDNSEVSLTLQSASSSKSMVGYIDLPGLSDAVNSITIKNVIDTTSSEEFELIYKKEAAIEANDPHDILQPYIVIKVLE